jgi:hypothetical protein
VGTPATVVLIALYVAGLILLDGRQTSKDTRGALLTRPLPRRAQPAFEGDAPLHEGADGDAGRLGQAPREGWLPLHRRLRGLEKAFAKKRQKLPWAGWTYSFAKKRKVYGLHIVALLWCTSDGRFRIPVAFRLWRPKRSCAPHIYRTKPTGHRVSLLITEVSGRNPKEVVRIPCSGYFCIPPPHRRRLLCSPSSRSPPEYLLSYLLREPDDGPGLFGVRKEFGLVGSPIRRGLVINRVPHQDLPRSEEPPRMACV